MIMPELYGISEEGQTTWRCSERLPAFVLSTALREHLFMCTKLRRNMAHASKLPVPFRYTSVEELVLFCGQQAELDILEHAVFPDMTVGRCFENAYEVSQSNPGWRYTEGWGLMEGSIPTHHAWLTGPQGEVADPTWTTLMRGKTHFPFDLGRVAYLGVSVTPDAHRRWFESKGYPNILCYCDMNNLDVMVSGMEFFDGL